MGVLQKAYTFVKKHWSIDDDVFPDDLNRYEDGIDDLYSVTNQTDTNIGNLSNLLSQAKSNIVTAINEIVTNLQSEIETRGNTDTELERQINVLSREALKYIGNITTFSEVNETGYYTVEGCLDGTIPIQYGTLKAYLSGSEKTIETVGFKDNKTIQCHASYNNNTKQWVLEQSATKNEINEVSNQKFIRSDANTEGRDTPTKPSEYTLGLFTNQIKTFASMGIQGSGFAHVIGVNEWTDTTAGVHELMFAGTKMYHRESISPDAWGQLYEIATTTKTDISSSSLLNGWTMWGNGYGDNLVGCKTGKQVQLNGLLRCGVKTQNTLILTLPEELRPTCSIIKNVSCYPYGAATIEIQSVGNVLVGNIGEGTLAISMGDVSYSTL